MAKNPIKLDLSKPEFNVRVQNFMNLMSIMGFQEEFLSNPGRVVARELGISGIKSSSVSATNRLVHKILVDPNFNAWAKDFQARIETEFPPLKSVGSVADAAAFVRAKNNRARLVEEFSKSALAHLAPGAFEQFAKAGLGAAGGIRAEGDVAVVPLTFIAIIVVIVIAAGVGRQNEQISRLTIATTINQLTKEQVDIVTQAAKTR